MCRHAQRDVDIIHCWPIPGALLALPHVQRFHLPSDADQETLRKRYVHLTVTPLFTAIRASTAALRKTSIDSRDWCGAFRRSKLGEGEGINQSNLIAALVLYCEFLLLSSKQPGTLPSQAVR